MRMPWRWLIPVLGLGTTLLLLMGSEPGAAMLALAVTVAASILLEWVAWLKGRTSRHPDTATLTPSSLSDRLDLRLDGRHHLQSLQGCERVPNTSDPRWFRFNGRRRDDADPLQRSSASLTRNRPTVPWTWTPPPLLGRVAIASAFLGKDGRSWTDREIARTFEAVLKAADWLAAQARRWRAAVEFVVIDTAFVFDDPIDDLPKALELVDFMHQTQLAEADVTQLELAALSRAAVGLGFTDLYDWFGWTRVALEQSLATARHHLQPSSESTIGLDDASRLLNVDRVVWLIHPMRAGQSVALPIDQVRLPEVHVAICRAVEDDQAGPVLDAVKPDPVTMAHELLHLFGATDKYGLPLTAFEGDGVTPRDIMRLDLQRLSALRIDRATAGELGWRTDQDPIDDSAPPPLSSRRRRPSRSSRRGPKRRGSSSQPTSDHPSFASFGSESAAACDHPTAPPEDFSNQTVSRPPAAH